MSKALTIFALLSAILQIACTKQTVHECVPAPPPPPLHITALEWEYSPGSSYWTKADIYVEAYPRDFPWDSIASRCIVLNAVSGYGYASGPDTVWVEETNSDRFYAVYPSMDRGSTYRCKAVIKLKSGRIVISPEEKLSWLYNSLKQ